MITMLRVLVCLILGCCVLYTAHNKRYQRIEEYGAFACNVTDVYCVPYVDQRPVYYIVWTYTFKGQIVKSMALPYTYIENEDDMDDWLPYCYTPPVRVLFATQTTCYMDPAVPLTVFATAKAGGW